MAQIVQIKEAVANHIALESTPWLRSCLWTREVRAKHGMSMALIH